MEAATKESRPLFTNQQLCALIVPLLIEQLLAVAVEEGIAVSSPESVSGTHEDVTLDGGYEY